MKRFAFWFFLSLSSCSLLSQETIEVDTNTQTSTTSTESSINGNKNFFTIFSGKPGKATLYSLLIPGGGQFYNKRYWKVPLVWAAEGTVIYNLNNSINRYRRFNTCYISRVDPEISISPLCGTNINSNQQAFALRNSARATKERYWVILIGVHLLQTLEAFIDRHLIDFDVSEDLSFETKKEEHMISYVPLFSLRFPLSKQ